MKKLLFCAAALLAFCACEEKQPEAPAPVPDSISVTPATATVPSKGGDVQVMVTSTGEWTLTGGFDWVTPSATEGKDGDVVTFTVAPNETEADKTAKFTFKTGTEGETTFTVTVKKSLPEGVDEIEITPETADVELEGGKVQVLVTSSGKWTLTGDCAWARASINEGEDGDVAEFTVDPNETGEDRTAEFTFAAGTAKATFALTQAGMVRTSIELVSEAEMNVEQAGGRIEIAVNSSVPYRDLTYAISEAAADWIAYAITLKGDGDNGAKMYFEVQPNPTYENRQGEITIIADETAQVTVKIEQAQIDRIDVEKYKYVTDLAGGKLEIPVTANVEYDVECPDWMTYEGNIDGKETFNIPESTEGHKGTITLTKKGGGITVEIEVMQKAPALIDFAPDFTYNRAWPAWNDPTPVNNMTEVTLETLVCATSTKRAGSLSTFFGIEGQFLLRMGDVGYDWNQIQFCFKQGYSGERKLTTSDMKISELNRWYHVAVTYGNNEVKCYLDGQLVGTLSNTTTPTVSLGAAHNDESGSYITRCFWVGYSYENSRNFPGMMSEIRIWNRVLTEEEINAENHFYTVDPASEGLVAYWKLNEGIGNVFKDSTSYGNDLATQNDVEWNVISLPE